MLMLFSHMLRHCRLSYCQISLFHADAFITLLSSVFSLILLCRFASIIFFITILFRFLSLLSPLRFSSSRLPDIADAFAMLMLSLSDVSIFFAYFRHCFDASIDFADAFCRLRCWLSPFAAFAIYAIDYFMPLMLR